MKVDEREKSNIACSPDDMFAEIAKASNKSSFLLKIFNRLLVFMNSKCQRTGEKIILHLYLKVTTQECAKIWQRNFEYYFCKTFFPKFSEIY